MTPGSLALEEASPPPSTVSTARATPLMPVLHPLCPCYTPYAQLEQREGLSHVTQGCSPCYLRLQVRLEQLEAVAAERLADLEAVEEEKYMLSSDLEVLQEELEDANAHQKRYYEALMSKEMQLKEMRSSCAALQKAVQMPATPTNPRTRTLLPLPTLHPLATLLPPMAPKPNPKPNPQARPNPTPTLTRPPPPAP